MKVKIESSKDLFIFIDSTVDVLKTTAVFGVTHYEESNNEKISECCTELRDQIARLACLLADPDNEHQFAEDLKKEANQDSLFNLKPTVDGLVELLEVGNKEETKLYSQLNSIECEVCDYRKPTKLEKKLIDALSEAIVSM